VRKLVAVEYWGWDDGWLSRNDLFTRHKTHVVAGVKIARTYSQVSTKGGLECGGSFVFHRHATREMPVPPIYIRSVQAKNAEPLTCLSSARSFGDRPVQNDAP
jgi:hypothetical protein